MRFCPQYYDISYQLRCKIMNENEKCVKEPDQRAENNSWPQLTFNTARKCRTQPRDSADSLMRTS